MIGAAVIGICAYGIIHDPVLGVILAVGPGTLGCFMDSILGKQSLREKICLTK